jgi:hypothetical protein
MVATIFFAAYLAYCETATKIHFEEMRAKQQEMKTPCK